MPCSGNGEDHCCWVNGKPCKWLEEYTVPGRRWACALMRELQDWDAVIASDRYKEATGGAWHGDLNCRDWPDGEGANKGTCKECGIT